MDASWAPRNAITMGPSMEQFVPAPRALPAPAPSRVGIIAMVPYVSNYYVSAEEMEKHGLEATHFLQKQNAVWDCNEDAISMALTAVQRLLEQTKIDPNDIGRLEVGTESNVDMAKSIKTYLMQLFPTNPEP